MDDTCSVSTCNHELHAGGLCEAHWKRLRRYGDPRATVPLRHRHIGTCSVSGCGRSINGNGLCSTHYLRWRKTGDPAAEVPVRVRGVLDHCTAGECDRPVYGHGYCVAHYRRWKKAGDPAVDRPLRMKYEGCTVSGCGKDHYAHGLCAMHWKRLRSTGSVRGAEPELIVRDDMRRFWTKTRELPGGCVEWTGGLNENGYGHFGNSSGSMLAHRWLWEQEHGSLDPKTHLDHYRYPQDGCIGPACVRHVRPTTAQENALRGDTIAAWNKAKTHCPQDHPYAGANLLVEKDGSRKCRTCCNARAMRYYYQRKAAR